jgi:hypothetical protein
MDEGLAGLAAGYGFSEPAVAPGRVPERERTRRAPPPRAASTPTT